MTNFGDLENPLVKHWTHLIREPVIQLGASMDVANKLNAKSNLDKRTTGNEINNALCRLWPTQLRQDVGIE